MKLFNYFLPMILLSFTVSCGDWLDITPKTQIGMEKMFNSERGYENVLIGCYTSLVDQDIYGKEMSYGMIDAMAQYYDLPDEKKVYYEATKYNFTTDANKDRITNLWLKSYFTIANCNVILDNLKKSDRTIFVNKHDILIEAEAKAMRALVHLNLLRLFAPTWAQGADKTAIPYANEYRLTPFSPVTMREFMKLVINDLQDSYNLLKDNEPLLHEDFSDNEYYRWNMIISGQNKFSSYRSYRLNFYAVTALLARAHHFMGESESALKYATEVMGNDHKFYFVKEGDLSGDADKRDAVFKSEILFGLQDATIFGNSYTVNNTDECKIYNYKELFPEFGSDFRCVYSINTTENKSLKYASSFREIIPMIRLSEVYIIASEVTFDDDSTVGMSYLNTLRRNRGLQNLPETSDKSEFTKNLINEARREFLAEGQMFYWYKQLGVNPLKGITEIVVSQDKMILPLPAVEVEFGNYNIK